MNTGHAPFLCGTCKVDRLRQASLCDISQWVAFEQSASLTRFAALLYLIWHAPFKTFLVLGGSMSGRRLVLENRDTWRCHILTASEPLPGHCSTRNTKSTAKRTSCLQSTSLSSAQVYGRTVRMCLSQITDAPFRVHSAACGAIANSAVVQIYRYNRNLAPYAPLCSEISFCVNRVTCVTSLIYYKLLIMIDCFV